MSGPPDVPLRNWFKATGSSRRTAASGSLLEKRTLFTQKVTEVRGARS